LDEWCFPAQLDAFQRAFSKPLTKDLLLDEPYTLAKEPTSWEEIPVPEVFAGGELTKVFREEFIKSLGIKDAEQENQKAEEANSDWGAAVSTKVEA
jgi:hypothetical protein